MMKFFFSYARDDSGRDGLVKAFYDHLCEEIKHISGWAGDDIGYLDVDMAVGTHWTEELLAALEECQVFVPLYTKRYFVRDYCGMEWHAFSKRVGELHQQLGKRPDIIIPVLWESVENIGSLPAVAKPLQYDQQKLGTEYGQQGLRRMVQHEARTKSYQKIVEHLAELIVKAADTHALPRSAERLSIDKLTNAFASAEAGGSSPAAASATVAAAPRQVHLVVCAGTAAEIGPLRDPSGCYGSTPEEWTPFRPAAQEPILAYAIDVARQRKLTPLHVPIDDDLTGRIKLAERRNTLFVLLIDGWSVRLASYQQRLAPYDDYLSLHTAVVVPYNGADPETERELPTLRARVRDVFRKNHGERRPSFREDATSLEEFQRVLHEVLVHVESRIFTDGEVARQATGEEPIELPTVNGPGGV